MDNEITPGIASMERQGCGCTTTTYTSGLVSYEPCLPCALANAGIMLQQAAERMREAEQARLDEAAELAEQHRVAAEDFIGGND